MDNKKRINPIIVFMIVILGLLGVKQIYATSKSLDITNEDNVMRLAYEMVETSNSNYELQSEINRLEEKNKNFSSDIKDRTKIKKELEERVQNYEMINGFDSVSGRGVEIKVNGDMITEEIVDLINGIRNTKPRGIAINDQRVITNSYFLVKDRELEFDNSKFDMPFFVQVIGNTDILENSLVRSGGILDIIKQNSFNKVEFDIEVKNEMTLPSYDGKINFREARIIN